MTLPGRAIPAQEQRIPRTRRMCEHSYERQSHKDGDGQPQYVDIWHCPLCGELTKENPDDA